MRQNTYREMILLLILALCSSLAAKTWDVSQIHAAKECLNQGYSHIFQQVAQIDSEIPGVHAQRLSEEMKRFHSVCLELYRLHGLPKENPPDFQNYPLTNQFQRYQKYPHRIAMILVYLELEKEQLLKLVQYLGTHEAVRIANERQKQMRFFGKRFFNQPIDFFVTDSVYALRRLAKAINALSPILRMETINENISPPRLRNREDIVDFLVSNLSDMGAFIEKYLSKSKSFKLNPK